MTSTKMRRLPISLIALLVLATTPVSAHHRDSHDKGNLGGGGGGADTSVSFNGGILDGTLLKFPALEDVAVSSKPKPPIKETELAVRNTSTEARAFLKFYVSGVTGPIASAKLLLRSIKNSGQGGEVREINTNWSESMTWQDQPWIDFLEQPLDNLGNIGNDSYYEWNVSPRPNVRWLTCTTLDSALATFTGAMTAWKIWCERSMTVV